MIYYSSLLPGLLGGAMNALAGGGSFVTLPVLVAAGVPSLNANATNTVALLPSALASAFAYRHDFEGFDEVKLSAMAITSVIGGAIGAVLLQYGPPKLLEAVKCVAQDRGIPPERIIAERIFQS